MSSSSIHFSRLLDIHSGLALQAFALSLIDVKPLQIANLGIACNRPWTLACNLPLSVFTRYIATLLTARLTCFFDSASIGACMSATMALIIVSCCEPYFSISVST